MNFIQRAIKNVTRRLSKTILLIITFFVIGNFVIIGLGVANAAENAKILTRKKMRAVVTYEVDYDAIMKYTESLTDQDEIDKFYKNYPSVKLTDIKDVLADKRVLAANSFSVSTSYMVDGYDYVHLNNEAEEGLNSNDNCFISDSGEQVCNKYIEPTHFVKANMFPNMIEFNDGKYTIVDGRFYTQEEIDNAEYVILISQAFAEVNGLKVGDTYTYYVTAPNNNDYYPDLHIEEEVYKKDFEIIGIFDHEDKILPGTSSFNYTYPYENPDNMLLIPATTKYMSTLAYEQELFDYYAQRNPDDEYYTPDNRPTEDAINNLNISDCTFLLNDPLEVDNFVETYKENLPQFMKLNANNEEFNRLSKPLDTLGLYANFIIWLVVINAIVIISLVTALTLKTREYEIGVLLSIGASKLKVVGQFFVELAVVAVIGFTLAVGSGSLVASKVGQTVLEYQIQESEVGEEGEEYFPSYDSIWNTNYTTKISLDDLLGEYNVTISPLIIGEIYILGLGIVLISIMIPSMMIMRFNPKKILMNQN